MVDIKGLDKARVLKALCDNSNNLYGRTVEIKLCGDEFDESQYDAAFGEGAAQRAVDSVRDQQAGGEDTAGNEDGEKKELSIQEKAELSRTAIIKILQILEELPPDVGRVTCMMLKRDLPGPNLGGMAGMLGMMGGPFAPPMGGLFG